MNEEIFYVCLTKDGFYYEGTQYGIKAVSGTKGFTCGTPPSPPSPKEVNSEVTKSESKSLNEKKHVKR